MLQQTQTGRVKPKYEAFIALFPGFETLANASQYDLLAAWQGLGYNRRALALQKSAQRVMREYGGTLPSDPEELVQFPGIGKATAASIAAFAFNTPTVFVETNIRVVFFHWFFQDKDSVDDKEILKLVAQTLDAENPREWYYALMDYGVMLKAQGINPLAKSKHYRKQSRFQGSDRQIRGELLRILLKHKGILRKEAITLAKTTCNCTYERVEKIIDQLLQEGFMNNTTL